MMDQLQIRNFRGIKDLTISQLSRVNLFVGRNNSGKTSILECIQFLASPLPLRVFSHIAQRRGEFLEGDDNRDREIDIKRFFYGHSVTLGTSFSISDSMGRSLTSSIVRVGEVRSVETEKSTDDPDLSDRYADVTEHLGLYIQNVGGVEVEPLSPQGGLGMRERAFRRSSIDITSFRPLTVITTESLNDAELAAMWDQIALTPAEEEVVKVLQILEPDVERIAFLSGRSSMRSRGGIVVKLRNLPERIPLGSFGDGIRRLLAISFATVQSAGGILLIDEIDTGLHFSTMCDMWRVLLKTAERLNVQIFATTHSQDCLNGLAWLYEQDPELASQITLQRIERGSTAAVRYTAEEIDYASRRHIEVR